MHCIRIEVARRFSRPSGFPGSRLTSLLVALVKLTWECAASGLHHQVRVCPCISLVVGMTGWGVLRPRASRKPNETGTPERKPPVPTNRSGKEGRRV
jgi:hypothetical protein